MTQAQLDLAPRVTPSQRHRTARERLLALLLDLAWHGPEEMERVAGNRYGARLHELRAEGYVIASTGADGEDNYGARHYRLESPVRGEPQTRRVRVYLDLDDALALRGGVITQRLRADVEAGVRSYRKEAV